MLLLCSSHMSLINVLAAQFAVPPRSSTVSAGELRLLLTPSHATPCLMYGGLTLSTLHYVPRWTGYRFLFTYPMEIITPADACFLMIYFLSKNATAFFVSYVSH